MSSILFVRNVEMNYQTRHNESEPSGFEGQTLIFKKTRREKNLKLFDI